MRSRIGIVSSLSFALVFTGSCSSKTAQVTAKQITSRVDLIGGPGALGEVGDYLLANEQVRVVIQGTGYSRGFGLYGGSLIDADLVRPKASGDSSGGVGYDNFSELFPAIFLKAMRPNENGIVVKEYEDGSASVIVRGRGAEFLFVAQTINDLLVDASELIFQNEYLLRPGKRYVEITTTVINQGTSPVELPGEGIFSLSDQLEGFKLPVGDVLLFGAGNDVFSEVAGFDLRYTLERLYQTPPELPKLPGLVTPFLATRGHSISYGFMSGITDPDLSFVAATGYDAPADSFVVPFIASSFTGAFMGAAPSRLAPRESFSYKKYFMIGGGDVASIRDVVHEIRAFPVGTFAGYVREARTHQPEIGVDVLTFDENGGPYSQHTTDSRGWFKGSYKPGKYTVRVLAEGRFASEPIPFEVKEGQTITSELEIPPAGLVAVRVHDQNGRALPAKCTLVGTFPAAAANIDPKDFLYDLQLGEHIRPTDLIPDSANDPSTREYIEHIVYAPSGQKTDKVRPGKYRAVCSRGIEYTITAEQIEVKAGELVEVGSTLIHALDTEGWASGDYHLHADPSVDSSIPLEDRVAHCAIEGVDIACSSDHNFVTDYGPYIAKLGLDGWVQGMIGLEMTTLEIGHFNGFPLSYDPGPITKGAFEWSGRPPEALLTDLRALGKFGPENTVVQVNHPRDTILGYFNNYNFNPDTGEPEDDDSLLAPKGPEFGKDKFTYNFDAIELYNGKRFELMHSYRVPEILPSGKIPPLEEIPPAGTVLRDSSGKVAFPGGMEDWFAMLDKGFIYTAMANSDTHSLEDEPGTPRTYVPVSDDTVGGISEVEIVAAIKNQRAMLTNGPFIRFEVEGSACHTQAGVDLLRTKCGMGEVVTANNGSVRVHVQNDMVPWMDIDRVLIYRNGEAVRTIEGDKTTLAALDEAIAVDGEGYVLVEVIGTKSLWPVVTPLEVPSIQVSDALGSIAGAFGIDFNPFGNLSPSRTTVAYPYAFTNPVLVDLDGDGRYAPPGVQQRALRATMEPRMTKLKRPDTASLPVLVKLFGAFAGHGH
jgi:hypothetical protein